MCSGNSDPVGCLQIKLIAPPLYVMTTSCVDKQIGLEIMEVALQKITESITKSQGNINVKLKVRRTWDGRRLSFPFLIDLNLPLTAKSGQRKR